MVHNIRIIAERGENGEVIGATGYRPGYYRTQISGRCIARERGKIQDLDPENPRPPSLCMEPTRKSSSSNPVAQEILGLSEEQLYGKTAMDPAWHFYLRGRKHSGTGRVPGQESDGIGKGAEKLCVGCASP